MNVINVELIQHAVGQGGLFSGTISADGVGFRWVYDCGSNQSDALTREVNSISRGGDIDYLFISHLDSDHVSGLDELLSRVKVKEVVLPYFSDEMLIAAVARDDTEAQLKGIFLDVATDPVAWFKERGIETVTFRKGNDDDGEGVPTPSIPPDGGGDKILRSAWHSSEGNVNAEDKSRIQSNDSVLGVTVSRGVDWLLIPYVHQPTVKRMDAFKRALAKEFGSPLDKNEIIQSLRSEDGRKKLRNCYDAIWKNHNLVSMTLYIGPHPSHVGSYLDQMVHSMCYLGSSCRRIYDKFPWRRRFLFHTYMDEMTGWMLTGDAHLGAKRRRSCFLKYYEQFLPVTSVIMLPHHGAKDNFSSRVLDKMHALNIAYAASGPNTYGHPNPAVINMVENGYEIEFHQVDEHMKNQLVLRVDFCDDLAGTDGCLCFCERYF